MRGERVIVRAFGNVPLIRRVWDSDKNAVYITDENQYQLLITGGKAIEPMGFPKEDVFIYDPKINVDSNSNFDWESLTQWG